MRGMWIGVVGVLLSGAVSVFGQVAAGEAPAFVVAPGYAVRTLTADWADARRDGRVVPIKAYLPVNAEGPRPVILFSHGLGGTREGYGYLGDYWASQGYVCVHLQHVGSDDSVWRDAPRGQRLRAMRDATKVLANSLNRPLDVSFVIDQLERYNSDTDSPFHGRLDLDRIGMAGHSYGAFTTMAVIGQAYVGRDGRARSWRDQRVDAAIVMSSQAPTNPDDYDATFGGIDVPVFYMTGTHDTSMIKQRDDVADRRVAYDHTPGPARGGRDTYLVTFTDGDHMIFSGRARRGFDEPARGDDALFQAHIRTAGLAFWNAYLRADAVARGWLHDGGFEQALGETGVLEIKP